MRVLSEECPPLAAASIDFSSRKRSSGLMMSGSNLIWNEALAGHISVTPRICAVRTAFVIDKLLKKASSDIASSHSTKICSSPPNE
jgi:hypothetical protein